MDFNPSMFTIICWSFTTVVMSHNIFVWWRPLPRSKRKMDALRKVALAKMEDADRDYHYKTFDEDRIRNEKSYEYLVLYSRLVGEYRTTTLKALASRIRHQRHGMRTFLRPLALTAQHVDVYKAFNDFSDDAAVNSGPDGDKNYKKLERTMMYALNHLDEAEAVLTVLRERGVYELKQVKSLVKETKESPAPTLSEGML
jgi:hypothetical protein